MDATIEQLKARITELEHQNAALRARVSQLESERDTLQETIWAGAKAHSRPPPPAAANE
jgi:cell division protein FtsB